MKVAGGPHRTIPVEPSGTPVRALLGAHPIHIDEEIAPLIAACWQLGISTVSSCQQGHLTGLTEISFHHHDDLLYFLNTLLGQPPVDPDGKDLTDPLARRMRHWGIPAEAVPYPGRKRWEFITVPEGYGLAWGLFCEVRFPHDDIPEVTWRLQAALGSNEETHDSSHAAATA